MGKFIQKAVIRFDKRCFTICFFTKSSRSN